MMPGMDNYQGNHNCRIKSLREQLHQQHRHVWHWPFTLVSDLIWLEEESHHPTSGAGPTGVEFTGSTISSPRPYGQNVSMANADNYSDWLVHANAKLQWQDVCKSSSPSGPSLAGKCAVQKIAQFGYGQIFNTAAEEENSYIFMVETRLGNKKYQANDSRIDRYWKRCKWSSSNSLDDFVTHFPT